MSWVRLLFIILFWFSTSLFSHGRSYRLKIGDPGLRQYLVTCVRVAERIYKKSWSMEERFARWKSSGTLEESIWREIGRLSYHNDRDFGDCCGVIYYILWLEREGIVLDEFQKGELIKSLKCILRHWNDDVCGDECFFHETRGGCAHLLWLFGSYFSDEERKFLQGFNPLKCLENLDQCVIPAEGTEEETASERPIPLERLVKGEKRSFWRACFPW
jgi:hypothetical protein